jgi:hypothetical protein
MSTCSSVLNRSGEASALSRDIQMALYVNGDAETNKLFWASRGM